MLKTDCSSLLSVKKDDGWPYPPSRILNPKLLLKETPNWGNLEERMERFSPEEKVRQNANRC
jgi:hypothetical protein